MALIFINTDCLFWIGCKKLKRIKTKVLPNCGDELFCGYYINFWHICFSKTKAVFRKVFILEKNIKKYIRTKFKDFKNSLNQKNKYRLNFYIEQEENLKK